ncbi:hypothetical protein L6R52_17110, partial [Myxococcota bacterium]|nr:hypothetical protein [Myxococcota bacterium]
AARGSTATSSVARQHQREAGGLDATWSGAVVTTLDDGALEEALGALAQGGVIVVHLRRAELGATTLRAVVAALRPATAPEVLELFDGGLFFVGRASLAGDAAWAELGSDAHLLALTEAWLGVVEADARATIDAMRARQAELVHFLAQTPLKLDASLRAAEQRAAEQTAALKRVQRTTIYQLGSALIGAARPSKKTVRLPLTLLELYREKEARKSGRAASPDDEVRQRVEARRAELDRQLEAFAARVRRSPSPYALVMYSGTSFIKPIRANRPIRLTRVLLERKIPVLFSYHGALADPDVPGELDPLLLQTPVDYTNSIAPRLERLDLGAKKKVFIVSYPHLGVPRFLNRLNAAGWSTLYDCRDDWEEFELAQPMYWYKTSVERFVVNNVDATFCVSRPLAEKIAAMTKTRPVSVSPNAYDQHFLKRGYSRKLGERIKIGYFGHLSPSWFDWAALGEIARARPGYSFEIIGDHAPSGLALPPNVALLGPKDHPEICDAAASWHAGIIPFKMGKLADAVDPIKIYEYFALELPVVSFRMPQIDDYPYTKTVTTVSAFAAALDAAVRERPDPAVLRAFLAENTWEHRVDQLLGAADAALARAPFDKTFSDAFARGA